jgi:hypothetical protein
MVTQLITPQLQLRTLEAPLTSKVIKERNLQPQVNSQAELTEQWRKLIAWDFCRMTALLTTLLTTPLTTPPPTSPSVMRMITTVINMILLKTTHALLGMANAQQLVKMITAAKNLIMIC